MRVTSDLTRKVIDEARARVSGARDLRDALRELAGIVGDHYEINRVSMRVLLPENKLEIAGVWSDAATRLGAGSIMSVLSSSLPEAIDAGHAIVRIGAKADALLDDVLRIEGIQAWVSIPLTGDAGTWGMLSFSSRAHDAFDLDDGPFFDALTSAVEPLLHELDAERRARS